MICKVCKYDAPYSYAQRDRRMAELDRNPTLDIFPCPDCGGTDYMLSCVNLGKEPPTSFTYRGMLSQVPPQRTSMSNDNDKPPSQQPPWWHGKASRNHILFGFIAVCAVVTLIIFALVVWAM